MSGLKTPRQRCDIHRVAGSIGIELREPSRQHFRPRSDRVCYAKQTLRQIGRRHGEGHLALVLRLIVQTRGNAGQLFGETIRAVSSVIADHPSLLDRGTALFDDFDGIDLADMRRQARALAVGVSAVDAMRVILAMKLLDPSRGA